MRSIVFYFQVHQPFRLRRYTFFDVGRSDAYFDDDANAQIVRRVAEKCYRPMNELLLRAIEETDGAFRCAFSVSGTALEQMALWAPEALESFRRLAATGSVELLAETSHHSLAALFDWEEFDLQVGEQVRRIEELCGKRPTTFRNTELVCSNEIARRAEQLGFRCILAEGADHVLGWRSPHRLYRPEGCERIKLLLRSYRLSDDVAFRFSNRGWDSWPLRSETFADWLRELPLGDDLVGLFMDYETFGEHQWVETGIFAFMARLPHEVLARGMRFETPAEVAARFDPLGRLDMPWPVSWADAERDLTAWLGNDMQKAAADVLWELGRDLRAGGDAELLERWRKLTTSDHLYYMCTKWFSDGDVHKYFSPFRSPHDAYIAFMNVLDDLGRRVRERGRRATA
jgi:alpha-amylase